jgi:hypothetical protein
MSQDLMYKFKENVKDFFLNPARDTEGNRLPGYNMPNVYAVLLGGFIGWLVLTLTFGAKLKALLKKVPVVNMLFKSKPYRRARRRVQQVGARRRTSARMYKKR